MLKLLRSDADARVARCGNLVLVDIQRVRPHSTVDPYLNVMQALEEAAEEGPVTLIGHAAGIVQPSRGIRDELNRRMAALDEKVQLMVWTMGEGSFAFAVVRRLANAFRKVRASPAPIEFARELGDARRRVLETCSLNDEQRAALDDFFTVRLRA